MYMSLIRILVIAVLFTLPIKVQAAATPESFADLVEKLSPAVVNISTTQTVKSPFADGGFPVFPPGHPFEQFNEFFENLPAPKDGVKATSLGSGFIISADGIVVTNNHVINDAEDITITTEDNKQYEAEIIGTDSKTDIALLKIKGGKKDFAFVPIGDSDKSRVGDWIVAIGNPFGLGGTVTAGIISARARDINSGPYDDFIQTDAAINRGNSGGPMFNTNGEVIGINSAIYSPSGGSVGIGFAIPSNMAKPIIESLKAGKKIKRGWLGVKIQAVSKEIAESIGLKEDVGALVAEVTPGSPAEKAGFKVGDIILSFNGIDIGGSHKLPRVVAETDVGKEVKVEVLRGTKKQIVMAKVGELKDEKDDTADNKPKGNKKELESSESILGIHVIEITPAVREKYELDKDAEGLLVMGLKSGSAAGEKGIAAGDILIEAGQKRLKKPEDFRKVVEEVRALGRKSVLTLVSRGGENIFVAIPVAKEKN
ncbi:MAG: DegQ family serine endoprotease [Proteobacteria bacterium]|nr:DegQ family serine endoprotease [Pseudomonadota bacterium]